MYIETSSPRLNREAAYLISPQISTADGNCLSFNYHMHGLNIRELSVYVQSLSGSRQHLWRLNGERGNAWKDASLPLHIPQDLTIKVKCNLKLKPPCWISSHAFINVEFFRCLYKCRRNRIWECRKLGIFFIWNECD